MPDKMTWDPNCYECKVRYRDPKANDLVMYLHAWRYKVFLFFKLSLFLDKQAIYLFLHRTMLLYCFSSHELS